MCLNRLTMLLATSGIAAQFLEGGRTGHSTFKLLVPLPLDNRRCLILFTRSEADAFRKFALLVWHEGPNAPKFAFEAVDLFLRAVLRGVPERDAEKRVAEANKEPRPHPCPCAIRRSTAPKPKVDNVWRQFSASQRRIKSLDVGLGQAHALNMAAAFQMRMRHVIAVC